MESLYQQTQNMVHDVQFTLARLEQARNEADAQPLFRNVEQQLTVLHANCNDLEQRAKNESAAKRRATQFKVEQLKFEVQGISSAVHHLQVRLTNKWRVVAEREELLTQRIKPTETSLNFADSELLVNDHLRHSHNAIDNMIAQGTGILENIKSQGFQLKDVKKKVLDIGQTLGLSGTTLRMIEKRLDEDWHIFIIGCFVILIFMYCFYRYWTG